MIRQWYVKTNDFKQTEKKNLPRSKTEKVFYYEHNNNVKD